MDFTVRDEDHINILAVCYWVFGALGIFTSIGAGLYMAFLATMMQQMSNEVGAAAGDIPELEMLGNLPGVILGLGVLLVVLGVVGAIMKIITGFLLKKRKAYTFCLITAGLTSLSLPFGTIIGVFTFVVLMRKQVARAFRTGEEAVGRVYYHPPGQAVQAQPQAPQPQAPQPQAPNQPPPGV